VSVSNDQELVIVYVPCGSEDEASHIASVLISEHLIACANIYASRSLCMWDGALVDGTEHVIWAKTTRRKVAAATKWIGELHSYDVPCILSFSPDSVNYRYASWLRGEVSGPIDLAKERAVAGA